MTKMAPSSLRRAALPLALALVLTLGATAQDAGSTSTTGNATPTNVPGANAPGANAPTTNSPGMNAPGMNAPADPANVPLDGNAANAPSGADTNGAANPSATGTDSANAPMANDPANVGNASTAGGMPANDPAATNEANAPGIAPNSTSTVAPAVSEPATPSFFEQYLWPILGVVAAIAVVAIVALSLKGRRAGQVIASNSDTSAK